MNTLNRTSSMASRDLIILISIVIIASLIIVTFQVRAQPRMTVINITVTPASFTGNTAPSFADFTKTYGAALPNDLALALNVDDQAPAMTLPVKQEGIVALKQITQPVAAAPVVQPAPPPVETVAHYAVLTQMDQRFGRIVALNGTWFQCRKLNAAGQFGVAYPEPGVWYTDNTDTNQWPTLPASAQQTIVTACGK